MTEKHRIYGGYVTIDDTMNIKSCSGSAIKDIIEAIPEDLIVEAFLKQMKEGQNEQEAEFEGSL